MTPRRQAPGRRAARAGSRRRLAAAMAAASATLPRNHRVAWARARRKRVSNAGSMSRRTQTALKASLGDRTEVGEPGLFGDVVIRDHLQGRVDGPGLQRLPALDVGALERPFVIGRIREAVRGQHPLGQCPAPSLRDDVPIRPPRRSATVRAGEARSATAAAGR